MGLTGLAALSALFSSDAVPWTPDFDKHGRTSRGSTPLGGVALL